VNVLTKIKSRDELSQKALTSLFEPKRDDQNDVIGPRIFPGLDPFATKDLIAHLGTLQKLILGLRTLNNIVAENRANGPLDMFYRTIENIPVWLSVDASRGYQGGAGIATRPVVEDTLTSYLGKSGNAAVHLFFLYRYEELSETAEGVEYCTDPAYTKRFTKASWYILASRIFLSWEFKPVFKGWVKGVEAVKEKGTIRMVLPLLFTCNGSMESPRL